MVLSVLGEGTGASLDAFGRPKRAGCLMKDAIWLNKEPISGYEWDRVKRCRALRDQLAVNLDTKVLFMSTNYDEK